MGSSTSRQQHIYSIEVPDSQHPGESSVFVNPKAKPYMQSTLSSGARTLYESFKQSLKTNSKNPYLGTRTQNPDKTFGNYAWLTYEEVNVRAERLGWGLKELNLGDKDNEGNAFLGIYSKNREEWIITDLACIFQDIVSVPIYDTLQPDALDYIVYQTQMRAVVCSEPSTQNIIKIRKNGQIPSLELIIQFDPISETLLQQCSELGLQIKSFEEVENLKKTSGVDRPPTPNSLFTLCYTSGTTGKAKGAMMKHSNFVSGISGSIDFGIDLYSTDVHISYLPLAHMMERYAIHHLTAYGSSIGFYQGDILKLRDDLALLKPTIFISVPRLYNRFYDLINQQFSDLVGIKRFLALRGLSSKQYYYNSQGTIGHKLWDTLVFKKIKQVLGGKIRLMATASAPLSSDVLAFLKLCFSCPLIEIYGQTETSAPVLATRPDDNCVGIVGGPTTTVEVKLVDVPDMNYMHTDVNEKGESSPRGEICMRGPTIVPGYYRNPEQTAEAIDEKGWLHSGDIGVRLPHNGAFKIIDRKKNFFKLQQGEYVAAEKIELVYSKSSFISQIFVYGDSFQCYLIAIIVPNEAFIRKKWLNTNGYDLELPFEEICKIPKLKDDILKDMNDKAKQDKLLGFEVVKKIHLEHQLWTPADLLTPTQKLMRFNAKRVYEEILNELYKNN